MVTYAAAIDVAKGSGWCAPGCRAAGRTAGGRRCGGWRPPITEVIALMDHLRCEGIQRLVLESTSDYWRIWLRHEVAHCE